MNRLLNMAPRMIEVGGAALNIDYSWRTAVTTIAAFKEKKIPDEIKMGILIENTYIEPFENDEFTKEAIDKALWFIRGGKEYNENEKKERPVICFVKDNQYIYDAFLKMGINLDESDMHWWDFKSRISELPECFLTRIMYLRGRSNKRKLSKEENKECAEIGWDIIELESSIILDEPDFEVF